MPSAVRLCVKDTGIGIAPEHRARLFDEFYQVANAERSADRGVGLGLAIVRRYAHRLGTQVDFASVPGQGSSFHLDLPLTAGSEAEERRQGAARP